MSLVFLILLVVGEQRPINTDSINEIWAEKQRKDGPVCECLPIYKCIQIAYNVFLRVIYVFGELDHKLLVSQNDFIVTDHSVEMLDGRLLLTADIL